MPSIRHLPRSLSSRFKRAALFLLLVPLLLAPAPARAASVELLDGSIGLVEGVSADGSTLVGRLLGNQGAFIWVNGTITNLGTLGGDIAHTVAYGISPDGSVAVGQSDNSDGDAEAFRWAHGTMIGLGFLDATGTHKYSHAEAASMNGYVVVGRSNNSSGVSEAFYWVNDVPGGTMTGLGIPGGHAYSEALAVSSDGSVVAGNAYDSSYSNYEAFRWVNTGSGFTATGLGYLDDAEAFTRATALSANGSVVVGDSVNSSGQLEAFRWQGGTMTGLGALAGGTSSRAFGVSSDGSVVVGSSNDGGITGKAFRWTQATGMVSLQSLLEAKGVDLTGWHLEEATGVSDNGAIIVGSDTYGPGTEYIANVSTGGLITPGQFDQSLGTMAQVGPAVASMGQISMSRLGSVAVGQGTRVAVAGRPGQRGLSSGDEMPGSLDLWMIGSVGTNIELNGDDLGLHGGLGLSWDNGGAWRFGAGLFGDDRDLDTDHGGNQRIKALGPGAFVVYSPQDTGFSFRVSALWQPVSLKLKRGYANGAGSATSTGSTDAEVFGLSGRAQWTTSPTDTLALTPFAEYTWQNTHIDGYSESGGPFPASYGSRNEISNSIRTGLLADFALFENLGTWTWAAWNHRFEDSSSALGGTAVGLGAFSYPGAKVDQDWADLGVGVTRRFSDRLTANASLGGALGCDDDSVPDLTVSVGFNYQLW